MTEILRMALEEDVAVLTLNRPAASNALSKDLRLALAAALTDLSARRHVRAVVLTGAGERVFCGGLDREELPEVLARLKAGKPAFDEDLAARLAAHTMPVIAAVNGAAMTGGLELMLGCDIVLAAETARFADTHTRAGVASMWGMTQRLPRRVGPSRAKLMTLTATWIDAEKAAAWGLVDEVLPQRELLPRALEIARAIASGDASVAAFARALIDAGRDLPLAEGLALETREATIVNRNRPEARSQGEADDRP